MSRKLNWVWSHNEGNHRSSRCSGKATPKNIGNHRSSQCSGQATQKNHWIVNINLLSLQDDKTFFPCLPAPLQNERYNNLQMLSRSTCYTDFFFYAHLVLKKSLFQAKLPVHLPSVWVPREALPNSLFTSLKSRNSSLWTSLATGEQPAKHPLVSANRTSRPHQKNLVPGKTKPH